METPSIADFKIANDDLLGKTIVQIEKDWNRAGLDPLIFEDKVNAAHVINTLNVGLNELIANQPDSLATLLYLIDLNEAKLIWQSGRMTIEKLTEEIVKREFYKVKLRSIL
jgi:hypothetical protein